MGRYDGNGAWSADPAAFLAAMQLPKTMVDTFLELDSTFGKMIRQREKKKAKKAGAK